MNMRKNVMIDNNAKVGYAFVVGDLLHIGHLKFFQKCKKYCDFLIVGVYVDKLVVSYKRKPIIPFEERIELVASIKLVDMVVKVENRDCTPMLKKLSSDGWKIDFLFHGDDWSLHSDDDLKRSKEYVESIGGRLILTPYYKEQTTTQIINQIKGEH